MTPEMWYTLIILFVAIILFVTEWIRLDIVAFGVVVLLMLTGVLTTGEALSGFSNSAVVTITALFVVGGAVMRTGLAAWLGARILTVAGRSQNRLVTVLMTAVAGMSSFMSNTGTVAVLMPAVVSLARSAKISPSKLLMPLAFAASLGGTATLIGTPPNLIVAQTLRDADLPVFGFFDFTPIALVMLLVGIVYMLFVGGKLLPDRSPKQEPQRIETPEELFTLYKLPDNLFRLRIRRESGLVGQTVENCGLRDTFNVDVLEIVRPAEPRSVMSFGGQQLVLQSDAKVRNTAPTGDTELEMDDVLIVRGRSNDVSHAAAFLNLGLQPVNAEDEMSLINDEVGLAEVVLPPRSSLVGKTLPQIRFATLYRLTVLGIDRPGQDEQLDLKTTQLQFADTLLVQGAWRDILALKDNQKDFVVMGQPEAMMGAPNRQKAPMAALVLAGMIVVMITQVVSITAASMLAALAMILLGCLNGDEAYESIDWKSVILIAGMIPMSTALEKVGLVEIVSLWVNDTLNVFGPVGIMAGLFLLTVIFTQVLSNTATTVLVAPIALASAQAYGVSPYAFLMAVALAASYAFLTPVASPVNTLVMGAGNYRFSDYMKVGVPLILITATATVLALPIFFPFA